MIYFAKLYIEYKFLISKN